MKRLAAFFCLCIIASTTSYSQTGFQKGRTWIGPTVGYGFGGIGFGAGGEYGITPNIGLGAELSYTAFTEHPIPGFDINYTLIGGLAAASYHFLPGEQLDPFLKVGVGYLNWDVEYKSSNGGSTMKFPAAYTSGVGITGQIGARYSVIPNMDFRIALGYPFIASAGLDFAFGGIQTNSQKKDSAAATIAQQGNNTPVSDKYSIFIGPYVTGKGSIPIDVAEGRLIAPGFNADFGVTTLIPFGKGSSLGVGLDLGYATYTYTTKPLISDDATDNFKTIKEQYSYINFAPYLNLGGFTLGINFGFPSSAEATNKNDSTVSMVRDTNTIFPKEVDPTQYLATLMEARVGGMIPVFSNEVGKLNVVIQAGYVFSGLYTDHRNYVGAYEGTSMDPENNKKPKTELNPTPVTFSLGLSYLFNLGF